MNKAKPQRSEPRLWYNGEFTNTNPQNLEQTICMHTVISLHTAGSGQTWVVAVNLLHNIEAHAMLT